MYATVQALKVKDVPLLLMLVLVQYVYLFSLFPCCPLLAPARSLEYGPKWAGYHWKICGTSAYLHFISVPLMIIFFSVLPTFIAVESVVH